MPQAVVLPAGSSAAQTAEPADDAGMVELALAQQREAPETIGGGCAWQRFGAARFSSDRLRICSLR